MYGFFKIKFIVIIYFYPYFFAQFHFFFFAISASFCYKIVDKKITANKIHNYLQHRKDKAQNDALTRLCMHNMNIFVTDL